MNSCTRNKRTHGLGELSLCFALFIESVCVSLNSDALSVIANPMSLGQVLFTSVM